MTTLLIADHDNGKLSELTARALTAALALGDEVHVLVAGGQAQRVAEAAARLSGAAKVLLAEGQELAHLLPEPFADLLVRIAPDYAAIVAPSTSTTRNVLPRAASMLDVMQVSDVIAVRGPDTFERPIYAGNAIQTLRSSDRIKLLTVRTTAFDPAPEGGSAPIESLESGKSAPLSSFVEDKVAVSERPQLMGARIVISGGRALGSREKFTELVLPLADKLGAAVGASRAAVDAGYAPNDWQVGQTGKVVAPQLYVACGISGAIQHLAGMKDSKTIVAINKDGDAPIFQIADYGLVGDLFAVLPELTAKL